ncbi:unnamed protein product, partial [Polarella glacialis]
MLICLAFLQVLWLYVLTEDISHVLSWTTWKCGLSLFYRGGPFFVAHYKKSQQEMVSHYKRTWNLTKEVKHEGYLGVNPLDDGDHNRFNACPSSDAARFGRYQRMAARLSWAERDALGENRQAPALVCLPDGVVLGPRCRKWFAILDVVVRDEPVAYVRQFIEHHLAVGFGHVLLGLDEGNSNTHFTAPENWSGWMKDYAEAFKPYTERGLLTMWSSGTQDKGHAAHVLRFASETFWMARVDMDELIVPFYPEQSVVPFLRSITGKPGQVPFQLKMGRIDYGDGGWTDKTPPPEVPLVEAYRLRSALPGSTKSFVQTDFILLPEAAAVVVANPHHFVEDAGQLGPFTCQDNRWVFGMLLWCCPDYPKVYWPPAAWLRQAELDVPLRIPVAQAVFDRLLTNPLLV